MNIFKISKCYPLTNSKSGISSEEKNNKQNYFNSEKDSHNSSQTKGINKKLQKAEGENEGYSVTNAKQIQTDISTLVRFSTLPSFATNKNIQNTKNQPFFYQSNKKSYPSLPKINQPGNNNQDNNINNSNVNEKREEAENKEIIGVQNKDEVSETNFDNFSKQTEEKQSENFEFLQPAENLNPSFLSLAQNNKKIEAQNLNLTIGNSKKQLKQKSLKKKLKKTKSKRKHSDDYVVLTIILIIIINNFERFYFCLSFVKINCIECC